MTKDEQIAELLEMAEKLKVTNAELDPQVREWYHVISKGGPASEMLRALTVHLFAERQFLDRVGKFLK